MLIAQLPRHHDNAVHSARLKERHGADFVLEIPMTTDEQRSKPCGLERLFDAPQTLSVKRTSQELGQHADAVGAPFCQTSRNCIGLKIVALDSLLDRLPLHFANAGRSVEYSRNRAWRNSRFPG